ncbi:MAG: hypothetical protein HOL17_12150 [Gammaproteobacteria bacterium]|jgi:hypothetical protein|nr:hypothetical protein [Gammaproteobacteria bacterium]MBT5372458.1 hypothetical protein [Gammaproteobacteria bacterium]MBT6480244.1 hypothetical protein [Gammaproteobacteria bacterium]MBT7831356.1 hypothetical protein [Candidatus Neomarinimicrobiota bacterium]HIJ22172.1 hypothetical protein [Gammaproteobacteria bacterium]
MHNQTTGSFPLEVSCNACHHYHFDLQFNGSCDQHEPGQSLDPLTEHCVHWEMYAQPVFNPYPRIHISASLPVMGVRA